MELSSSAVTGAMRVGLQIVSSHKSPVLEVYHQVRNRFGPEFEYEILKGITGEAVTQKTRFQDVFIEFTLVDLEPKSIRRKTFSKSMNFVPMAPSAAKLRQC